MPTSPPSVPDGVATDAPALEISGLRFRHDDAGRAWTIDLDELTLGAGEQVLLQGGSGTGKSTLLLLIAGLLDADDGVVRVAGQEMGELHGPARDRFRGNRIGMIFQTFQLLEGFTAVENVLAALLFSDTPPAEHRERAESLLRTLGIERMDATPDRLSVGQQQRVAVARALACKPVLVLADEPTASLDPDNAEAAMTLIQDACRDSGAALLCTSHDPTMPQRFERVVPLAGAPTP